MTRKIELQEKQNNGTLSLDELLELREIIKSEVQDRKIVRTSTVKSN